MSDVTVKVSRKALGEVLNALERIIPNRPTHPIMGYLKIEVSPGNLALSAANNEVEIQGTLSGETSESAGSAILPAHLFIQIVKNISSDTILLSFFENECQIQGEHYKTKLQTGNLDSYPSLSFLQEKILEIDAKEFSKSILGVRYAVSMDAFQAVFRGIKIEMHENITKVVASDGFRLAIKEFPSSSAKKDIIIPARAIDEIVRLFKDGKLYFTFLDGKLCISTEKYQINVKLLEGEFPDYERVIPKEIKLSIKLSANDLKESVHRVAVMANKAANNRVDFQIANSTLQLSAEGDYGRSQDVIEVDQLGSEVAMVLGFNAKYVTDALGPIEGEVVVEFSGPNTPAVFRSSQTHEYLAVVVPLRS
ncbi:MAG: DNA polymerase III subunit beta [Deinococcaceae bacterium]